jgi:hypothetical protein
MASKSIQILVNEISGLGRYGALEQSPRAIPSSQAQARDLTNEIIVTQENWCDSISKWGVLHFVQDGNGRRLALGVWIAFEIFEEG